MPWTLDNVLFCVVVSKNVKDLKIINTIVFETEDVKMDEVDAAQIVEGELAERRGFTSEIFKIELNGIPKFFGANQVSKSVQAIRAQRVWWILRMS